MNIANKTPLLQIEQLQVHSPTAKGMVHPVRKVSLQLQQGEMLALVGESGSGKSITAQAIMGLLPDNAVVSGKTLQFERKKIAMIFQNPMATFNPVLTIGYQIAEPLRVLHGYSKKVAEAEAIQLLERMQIRDAAQKMRRYAHEFSGGMLQRAAIAMALACKPQLLIADEPTTALDATIQGQILRLLAARCRERRMAVLLITHDLGVAAQMADTVGVMYAGRLVESAPAQDLFADARHPYTQGLLHAAPSARSRGLERLPTIPGTVPSLQNMPTGCPFHPRCTSALPCCTTEMPPTFAQGAHRTACWLVKPA